MKRTLWILRYGYIPVGNLSNKDTTVNTCIIFLMLYTVLVIN
jgi:hypothetical protein